MNKPLVSLIILSYKNYKYIYEALESVLCQDYPNIEIVISNDGSDDFNIKEIKKYLNKNKKNNIKNIVINNNSKNIGTVKNINKAIKLSKGEYIFLLAADDTIYDNKVISKLLSSFNKLPKKELVLISQVGMYDIKLKKLIQPFLSNEDINRIKTLTPQKLFAEMSTRCIVPGSGICYKRNIFKKYGYFDENYVLVEDFSYGLKLSRLGIKHNYVDSISVKHRDGGISHGNINGEIHKNKQYDLDILNILKNEVKPYLHLLTREQKKYFLSKLREQQWDYSYHHEIIHGTKKEKRHFVSQNWKNGLYKFFNDFFTDIKDQFKGKKFSLFIIGSILSLNTNKVIYYLGLILIAISIFLTIIFFGKKYLTRIYNFIKFII